MLFCYAGPLLEMYSLVEYALKPGTVVLNVVFVYRDGHLRSWSLTTGGPLRGMSADCLAICRAVG